MGKYASIFGIACTVSKAESTWHAHTFHGLRSERIQTNRPYVAHHCLPLSSLSPLALTPSQNIRH